MPFCTRQQQQLLLQQQQAKQLQQQQQQQQHIENSFSANEHRQQTRSTTPAPELADFMTGNIPDAFRDLLASSSSSAASASASSSETTRASSKKEAKSPVGKHFISFLFAAGLSPRIVYKCKTMTASCCDVRLASVIFTKSNYMT